MWLIQFQLYRKIDEFKKFKKRVWLDNNLKPNNKTAYTCQCYLGDKQITFTRNFNSLQYISSLLRFRWLYKINVNPAASVKHGSVAQILASVTRHCVKLSVWISKLYFYWGHWLLCFLELKQLFMLKLCIADFAFKSWRCKWKLTLSWMLYFKPSLYW